MEFLARNYENIILDYANQIEGIFSEYNDLYSKIYNFDYLIFAKNSLYLIRD